MNTTLRGFSLLEVMVAIALLSMGIVLLLQVQARSIQLAQDARFMTVATMLARGKLYDCQQDLLKKGFSIGDYDEEGSFDEEGYPNFYWECHAYKPELPVPDATDITTSSTQAAEAAGVDAPAGQDMGLGMLAPVLSQISGVLGDSIRELVVIVRWQDGPTTWQDMRVTTHVIDKTAVNGIGQAIRAQTGALDALTGGGGQGAGGQGAGPQGPGAGPQGGTPPRQPSVSPTGPGGAPLRGPEGGGRR